MAASGQSESLAPAAQQRGLVPVPLLVAGPGSPGVLLPIPRVAPAEVKNWWSGRVPFIFHRDGIPTLKRWEEELTGAAPPAFLGWAPSGPGRTPYDAAPLIEWLRSRCLRDKPLTFNAMWKEKHGGRLYPYHLRRYTGQLTISRYAYNEAGKRGPKLLLSAIRRDARTFLTLPDPWEQLVGDFTSCHGHIAFGLSGDVQLAADLAAGLHQVTGDWLLTAAVDPPLRRAVGKAVNNAMLFGMESGGFHRLINKFFPGQVTMDWATRAWQTWWARYPTLSAFRDQVRSVVLYAQSNRRRITITAPSGRPSRFSPGEVLGQIAKGSKKAAPGISGAWRTVFSAVFRAVEGDLLDQTLRHLHSIREHHGIKLALPLYDGVVIAAPKDGVERASKALMVCAQAACNDLGLPALSMTVKPAGR